MGTPALKVFSEATSSRVRIGRAPEEREINPNRKTALEAYAEKV